MGLGELIEGSLTKSYVVRDAAGRVSTLSGLVDVVSAITPGLGFTVDALKAANVALGNPGEKAAAIIANAPNQPQEETLKQLEALARETGEEAYTQYLKMLEVLRGNTARMQLEAIIGGEITPEAVITNKVFDQITLVTNLNVGIQITSIIAEILSIGQIDRIGEELRSYLDYSGLSQITGYGYGQILAAVLGQPMAQELLAQTRTTQPTIQDLTTLLTRGSITKDEYMTRSARLGFSDDLAAKLYDMAQFYPQVQDWIRFSVRDVFNPDVVESAGLNMNFPEDIVEYAAKAGVSKEVLEWFWRAHWQLPSPNQAYEMYHRGYITKDGLRNILVAADYAPGYIDAYMGIAETPYTRVDARRMLAAGVLSNEEYVRAMMDIGYSKDKAEKLLEWALNEDGSSEKDLTIAQYMRGYDLGLVTENELRVYVAKQGYDPTETDTLVSMHIIDYNDKRVAHSIKYYDKLYQRSDIDDAGYLKALNALAIPLSRANEMLGVAKEKKIMAQKLPTKADVMKWYSAGNITMSEAKMWLMRIGYTSDIAQMYIDYSASSESDTEESQ